AHLAAVVEAPEEQRARIVLDDLAPQRRAVGELQQEERRGGLRRLVGCLSLRERGRGEEERNDESEEDLHDHLAGGTAGAAGATGVCGATNRRRICSPKGISRRSSAVNVRDLRRP